MRIPRRQRLNNQDVEAIASYFEFKSKDIGITDNTVKASFGHTAENNAAYCQIVALLHSVKNENGQTIEDLYIDTSCRQIVSRTIRKLQDNYINRVRVGLVGSFK